MGENGSQELRPRDGGSDPDLGAGVPPWQRFALAAFFAAMGLMIVLVAVDLGPMAPAPMHAPRWVVGLGGTLFVACGLLLVQPGRRIGQWLAGSVVLAMTLICTWVALFAESRYFITELGLLPREMSVLTARILFGAVAVLGLLISMLALFKGLKRDRC